MELDMELYNEIKTDIDFKVEIHKKNLKDRHSYY